MSQYDVFVDWFTHLKLWTIAQKQFFLCPLSFQVFIFKPFANELRLFWLQNYFTPQNSFDSKYEVETVCFHHRLSNILLYRGLRLPSPCPTTWLSLRIWVRFPNLMCHKVSIQLAHYFRRHLPSFKTMPLHDEA